MSGWATDNDEHRRNRLNRPRSYFLKALLYRLVFWMDNRNWQLRYRRLYRLTWNLYWKVQWHDDRSEAYPSVPW